MAQNQKMSCKVRQEKLRRQENITYCITTTCYLKLKGKYILIKKKSTDLFSSISTTMEKDPFCLK